MAGKRFTDHLKRLRTVSLFPSRCTNQDVRGINTVPVTRGSGPAQTSGGAVVVLWGIPEVENTPVPELEQVRHGLCGASLVIRQDTGATFHGINDRDHRAVRETGQVPEFCVARAEMAHVGHDDDAVRFIAGEHGHHVNDLPAGVAAIDQQIEVLVAQFIRDAPQEFPEIGTVQFVDGEKESNNSVKDMLSAALEGEPPGLVCCGRIVPHFTGRAEDAGHCFFAHFGAIAAQCVGYGELAEARLLGDLTKCDFVPLRGAAVLDCVIGLHRARSPILMYGSIQGLLLESHMSRFTVKAVEKLLVQTRFRINCSGT
jgi:hypothetical protein